MFCNEREEQGSRLLCSPRPSAGGCNSDLDSDAEGYTRQSALGFQGDRQPSKGLAFRVRKKYILSSFVDTVTFQVVVVPVLSYKLALGLTYYIFLVLRSPRPPPYFNLSEFRMLSENGISLITEVKKENCQPRSRILNKEVVINGLCVNFAFGGISVRCDSTSLHLFAPVFCG